MDNLIHIISAIAPAALGAIAAYAAIRSDLAEMKAQIKMQGEAITRAHDRIDDILARGK